MNKINLKKYLLLTCCISLTACSTTKISQQEATLRQKLITPTELKANYQINEAWWTSFNLPELNQLIDLLHKRNTTLQKAKVGVQLRQLQLDYQLIDLFLPNIGGQITQTTSGIKNEQGTQYNNPTYQGQTGLSYEAHILNKINRSIQTGIEKTATEEDIRTLRMTLEAELVRAYIQWGMAEQSLHLLQEEVNLYKNIQSNLTLQYRYGRISELDYETAKLNIMQATHQQYILLENKQNIERNIRNLLSLSQDESIPVQPPKFDQINQLPTVQLDIPLSTLINRPDVHAAMLRLDTAWFKLHHQYINWLPKLSIQAGLSSSSPMLGEVFSLPLGLTHSLSVQLPFLNFPKLIIENKKANLEVKQAAYTFEETLIKALNETAFLFKRYQRLEKLTPFLNKKYQQAKRVKHIQTWQYKENIFSMSDYLKALQSFRAEENAYLQSQFERINTQITLYQSLGGDISRKP